MAHYAFLDSNNVVTEVIVGIDENELIKGQDPETWYGNFRGQTCKRTSYNNNYRFNYAGIGYTYFSDADAFVAPAPCEHSELTLNQSNYRWECSNSEHEPILE